MDSQGLLKAVIGTGVSLTFLIALCGSQVSASETDSGAAQDVEIMTQAVSQAPSDRSKAIPSTPKDLASMAGSRPIRVDNPVACYSTCVIGCNARQEGPARPYQKRCANYCWKE